MAKGKKNKRPASTTRTDIPVTSDKNGILSGLENLNLDGHVGTNQNGQEEMSPRLLALQQQLEKLDADRYLLQRADEPLETLNSSANKTELSLQSLKKRLSEVRQQLYGTVPPPTPTTSLANLAKNYFGGMIRGKRAMGFAGEENFDEEERGNENGDGDGDGDEDFEFEISESEYFEDELMNETNEMPPADNLLDATRLGLRLFGRDSELDGTIPADYELVTKAEAELDAALELVASPSLTNERKLEILREKFANVIKQDLHWRGRVAKATRLAHDERIQRQLIEMELDKANAIKHRLESLCRDLHNENRRIKAEKSLERQQAEAAENEKLSPPSIEFNLPTLPDKTVLAKESSAALADRIVSLADLFLSREQHFANLLRLKETEALNVQEKANMLADQLGKQTSLLETNSRRISALTRSEQDLKAQVRQYVEKFRQVEETLGKSNDLFGTFRAEMEQMGAKLARLERENTQLNSKCATLSRNIIEMADERTKQNATLETIKGQKAKLEQLCRTLQAERNAALKNMPSPPSDDNAAAQQ